MKLNKLNEHWLLLDAEWSLYFIKPSECLIRQPLQDTFIQVQLTLEAEPKLVISLLTSLSQARC